MTTISAKMILSSQHQQDVDLVLSTILARYPRKIHSEMLTHRDKSRNSASSRAIPIEKLIWEAENDPAVPIWWGKNQKGMQAYEELEGSARDEAINIWHEARLDAIKHVKRLDAAGLHKQEANRLLEPYIHITVLYSGTEWSNFLGLRNHHAAAPDIQRLAKEFHRELELPPMQYLYPGEWHMPFITDADREEVYRHLKKGRIIRSEPSPAEILQGLMTLSTARCASTSYKTVDGFDMTPERAQAVFDSLSGSDVLHASPFEHVAHADQWGDADMGSWAKPEGHRNFNGFVQYRHYMPNDTL